MFYELDGIFPATITPFAADGSLDVKALRANIRRWNQYGLRGYLVCGSTGESAFLSDAERTQIIQITKETMLDGMTLLAGTGRESTAQTIKTCQSAANAGADAALVITPGFYRSLMTARALEKHYRAIADASSIPILLYNMPAFTGVSIPLDLVISLSQHPNVVGIKDSSGNSQFLAAVVRGTPTNFAVFSGNVPTFAQALVSKASGGILAIANLVPEICVALYRAGRAHNYSEVQRLHNLLQTINEVVGGAYAIGGLKYAMALLGYAAGVPRPPLLSPSQEQIETIKTVLQTAGLLDPMPRVA